MKARQHSTFGRIILLIALAMVRQTTSKCAGGFDVYFLLDKSSSVAILDFQVSSSGSSLYVFFFVEYGNLCYHLSWMTYT